MGWNLAPKDASSSIPPHQFRKELAWSLARATSTRRSPRPCSGWFHSRWKGSGTASAAHNDRPTACLLPIRRTSAGKLAAGTKTGITPVMRFGVPSCYSARNGKPLERAISWWCSGIAGDDSFDDGVQTWDRGTTCTVRGYSTVSPTSKRRSSKKLHDWDKKCAPACSVVPSVMSYRAWPVASKGNITTSASRRPSMIPLPTGFTAVHVPEVVTE